MSGYGKIYPKINYLGNSKMKTKYIKTLLAGAMLTASQGAFAVGDNFAIDMQQDFDTVAGFAGCASGFAGNCTGTVTEMSVLYNSETIITDDDGNAGVTAGDSLVSGGGVDIQGVGGNATAAQARVVENSVTAFTPLFPNNDYGFNDSWLITFGFTDLTGTLVALNGGLFPSYNGGTINMYLYADTDNGMSGASIDGLSAPKYDVFGVNFMNFDVISGGPVIDPGTGKFRFEVLATPDFTGIASTYRDMFGFTDQTLCGKASFFDIWTANCNAPAFEISALLGQDVDPLSGFAPLGGDKFTAGVVRHDGSLDITAVPEPGVIALMGFGLVMLGFTGRRRENV